MYSVHPVPGLDGHRELHRRRTATRRGLASPDHRTDHQRTDRQPAPALARDQRSAVRAGRARDGRRRGLARRRRPGCAGPVRSHGVLARWQRQVAANQLPLRHRPHTGQALPAHRRTGRNAGADGGRHSQHQRGWFDGLQRPAGLAHRPEKLRAVRRHQAQRTGCHRRADGRQRLHPRRRRQGLFPGHTGRPDRRGRRPAPRRGARGRRFCRRRWRQIVPLASALFHRRRAGLAALELDDRQQPDQRRADQPPRGRPAPSARGARPGVRRLHRRRSAAPLRASPRLAVAGQGRPFHGRARQ